MALKIAIVGRPNVGKSTLFNRLVGRKLAIVNDTPGVTRDWRSAEASLGGVEFLAIDTAGLDDAPGESIEAGMQRQTERALEGADLALFLIDARTGITPMDRHFADWLRRGRVPVILVANKAEGRSGEAGLLEAFELGMGEAVAISAEHGEGMGDLLQSIEPYLPETPVEEEAADETGPIQLAILGRPNVGKSTLMNALVGEERVLTSDQPGTTRDAISVDWEYRDRQIRLIDTAGMRRRARIVDDIEKLSVGDTLHALRFAHVAVLVLDADAILDSQDLAIARLVVEEGRALVIAVNKWDAVADRSAAARRLQDRIETSLAQAKGVPTVTMSALKRQGLDALLDAVLAAFDVWNRRISTARLNRWLQDVVASHPAPAVKGRPNRLRYMTQLKARPPTFAVWAAHPDEVPESYSRYLVNGIREAFDLPGIPIRLMFRKSRNPYAAEAER